MLNIFDELTCDENLTRKEKITGYYFTDIKINNLF